MIIILGLYNNIALFLSFENSFKDNASVELKAEIISLPKKTETTNKYSLKVISNRNSLKINNKKFIIYTKAEIKLNPGDIVYVKGILKKAPGKRILKGFNYNTYLKSQKIYGIVNADEIHYLKTRKDFSYFIGEIQSIIYNAIDKSYSEKYQAFISKILFGADKDIEEEIKDNFKASSLSHVIAISGMHITYIVLILNLVLKYVIKNIKIRNILLSVGLVFFVILTGASASCARACIMSILVLISKNIYRKNNVFISMAVSFCFLHMINIYTIFDIGMWLSFFGTLGILTFYKFLKLFVKFKSNKFFYEIQNIALVSVSAQILIWPVILYVFNTVSLTFFISNILITPIVGPIIIIGYISILFVIFFYPIGSILVKIEEFFCFILFNIAKISAKLPLSTIYISGSHEIFIISYYCILVYFIYYFSTNKWKMLRKIITINRNIKLYGIKKSISKCIEIIKLEKNKKIIIVSILMVISIGYFLNYKKLELYFVDVGQGDCTIIKTKSKNIIIDGGEGNSDNKYDYGKNVVLGHLLKLGINKIDYMIFSHFDSDHSGGLIHILENLKVEKIVFGLQFEDSECLRDVVELAKKKNIEIIVLKAGDKVEIDKNCYIDVFLPNNNQIINENVLNNNSLVLKFVYKDFSILFTGDIEEIAENKMIELNKGRLKSTVLKVSHHGSKTSTTPAFLKEVSPIIALIGVGENNNFGHPNKIILERLQELRH